MGAALFSHITLVIAALFLVIGSGGQAWESMVAYRNELHLVRLLIDERIEDMADKPPRITVDAGDVGLFVYDIIAIMIAIPIYLRYLFSYIMFVTLPNHPLLKPFDNYVQEKKKAREADPGRRAKIEAPPDEERMHALRRTAVNWAFIMLGSLAALVASMTDLIVSLS
jgi:hypothetical protein